MIKLLQELIFEYLYFLDKEADTLQSVPEPSLRKREPKKVAESPAEAVSSALQRRMVSTKINQDAIERLVQASVEVRYLLYTLNNKSHCNNLIIIYIFI